MTTDKTKARIQELCPDVLELKFGCEVKSEHLVEKHVGPVIRRDTNKDYPYFETMWGGFSLDGNGAPTSPFIEILGSPITLSVVLRAIEVVASRSVSNIQDGDEAAHEYYHNRERWLWSAVDMWNLSLDNYDDQSQPTKDFIGNLLGV
jgi:hypothetical protein